MREPQTARRTGRPELLDALASVFLIAGLTAVLAGFLPTAEAGETVRRVLPLLIFLGSVIVLAELTAKAEVFDVVAVGLARRAGGNYAALFVLCVGLASATTIFLNLDTTAVLLTPVMLAIAAKLNMAPLPLAMLTVWLANTASLLLPVSNLTNLLAFDRVNLTTAEFAARMAARQAVAILVTAGCLWVCYWRRDRRGSDRYAVPDRHSPRDRVLFRTAAGACAVFIALVLLGVPLAAASLTCMGLLVAVFVLRDRSAFTWRMIPLRLLAFVTGLFLVVQTVDRYGLGALLGDLMGSGDGGEGVARAATIGIVLSNTVNNLPAYVAGEAVVANDDQLLGLLIATNVSPLITPWASLAILLWYERCRAGGVRISWGGFAARGAVCAVATLVGAESALLLTR